MEKEIFEWQQFDYIEDFAIQFEDCIFIKDFGPYHKNEEVKYISIDYQDGIMNVYRDNNDGTEPVELKLELKVKE